MERLDDQDVRKVTKVAGHSAGITLPIELVRQLGWKIKQKVTVRRQGKKLVVEDWKK